MFKAIVYDERISKQSYYSLGSIEKAFNFSSKIAALGYSVCAFYMIKIKNNNEIPEFKRGYQFTSPKEVLNLNTNILKILGIQHD